MPVQLREPWGGTDAVVERSPGQPIFDPTIDDAYDQVVLADLPAQGWYWKLLEQSGTSLADRGTYGRTLVLSGGSAQVNYYAGPTSQTPVNTSVRFDGANNSKASAAPFPVNFPARSPFSVELWIYPTSQAQANPFVLSNFANGAVGGWNIRYLDAGTLRLQRIDVAGSGDSILAAVAPYRWTHVLYTYDGSNMNMYRDGVLVAGPTASTRNIEGNISPVFVMGNFSPTGTGNSFTGYLARVAIYGTALTATQAFTHAQAGQSGNRAPDLNPNPLGLQLGNLKWDQDFAQAAATTQDVAVTPSIGLLTLTADTNVPAEAIAPTIGTLTLTSDAPAVSESISPAIGTLTLTSNAPSVAEATTPSIGVLNLTSDAPTVQITGNVTVNPSIGALTLTADAPTVKISTTPGIGSLSLQGLAPTVAEQITPSIGSLALTADASAVSISVTPSIGVLTLTADAPNIANRSINVPTGVLNLTADAPTISGGVSSAPTDRDSRWLFFFL